MVRTYTPGAEFGAMPPDFKLPATDGKTYMLADCRGKKGTLVMFICNHCPYVKGAIERIVRDCRELEQYGVRAVAIMSNDPADYPEDSFENMQAFAREHHFSFPYLMDESQETAKAYGAVCTPDFFGYNANLELQFRGRIDEGGKEDPGPDAERELFNAMKQIAQTGQGPKDQTPSVGCSIKWKVA